MRILVTGVAGFIGAAVAQSLLARGDTVVGVDSLNAYYDVGLKRARLESLLGREGFTFLHQDLADRPLTRELFASILPQRVVHMAAQAGVRYSIDHPDAYVDANLVGFMNILEGCRHHGVEHLVYASSSSVYGANTVTPLSVAHNVDHPVSIYAATKKANELMAHTYSHLYGLPTTGLRFFTVYGPWGRPDMSPFIFTNRILAGLPLDVFNNGDHKRDFTYIDDIVDGVVKVLDQPAAPDPDWSGVRPRPDSSAAPYRLYNIGNNKPVELLRYIAIIEACTGRKAVLNMLPAQPGDVHETWADIDSITAAVGYAPATSLEQGMASFVSWYKEYYGVQ